MTTRKNNRVLLESAARTATPDVVKIKRKRTRNMRIVIDVTAIAATPSVTPTIKGVDAAGVKYDLLPSIAAISTVSTVVLNIGNDTTDAAGLAAKTHIPGEIELLMTHGDADSITYSVSAEFDDEY